MARVSPTAIYEVVRTWRTCVISFVHNLCSSFDASFNLYNTLVTCDCPLTVYASGERCLWDIQCGYLRYLPNLPPISTSLDQLVSKIIVGVKLSDKKSFISKRINLKIQFSPPNAAENGKCHRLRQ